MTAIENFIPQPISSPIDSDDAIMDLSDTTPLDLSTKTTNKLTSPPPKSESPKIEIIESLSELANLQHRFIPNIEKQNYVDQLQKVANGPTIMPPNVSTNSRSTSFQKDPSTPPAFWPSEDCSSALYSGLPFQYQLAASQLLWSSGYAAAAAALKNQLPVVPNKLAQSSRTDFLSPFPSVERRATKGSRKYLDSQLASTPVAPPESFGISMRGNQKYSAYYQRPFLVPLAPSKRPETSAKRSATEQHSPSSEDKLANTSRVASKETAFQCSCGEEFENLYIFTLHMKESNHSPKCARNERDIPKLVRGQDMWINSEIEQTREILRCMRCHQSFRTLPDLTMHMIKTSHYSEIVYSDSGRCVFVNSEDNNNNASKKAGDKRSASINNSNAATKHLTNDKDNSKLSDCNISKKMPRLKPEVMPTEKNNYSKLKEEIEISHSKSKHENPDHLNLPSFKSYDLNHTMVTEADSATANMDSTVETISESSVQDSTVACNENIPNLKSVISQIESFVEKNLPRTSSTPSGKHTINACSSPPNKLKDSHTKTKESIDSDKTPYVAPDGGARPNENPLSSLQKLVETTRKTNINKDSERSPTETSKSLCRSLVSTNNSGLGSVTSQKGVGAISSFLTNNPTVIMVNPTYIYQPPYSSLSQLYNYPWYQSLPMYGAGMGTTDGGGASNTSGGGVLSDDDESPCGTIDCSKTDISPSVSPKCEEIVNPVSPTLPTLTKSDYVNVDIITNSETTASVGGPPSRLRTSLKNSPCGNSVPSIASTGGGNSGSNFISKKSKCNYCGKPFANKGQVRLHISKGKCPSLLQSCHSNELPSLLTNPFSYIPMEYIDRSSEERLRMLYSLTKHMVTKEAQ